MCRIKNRYVSSVTCLATSNKNSKRDIATKIGTNPEDTGTTVQVAHISIQISAYEGRKCRQDFGIGSTLVSVSSLSSIDPSCCEWRANWNWKTVCFLLALFLIVCINMQISVYRDWLKCPITTQTVVFQVANQTASYCMTKTK